MELVQFQWTVGKNIQAIRLPKNLQSDKKYHQKIAPTYRIISQTEKKLTMCQYEIIQLGD